MLVYGGYNERQVKLGDLWELCTSGTATQFRLQVGLRALLTDEEQEAEFAAKVKAAGKKAKEEDIERTPLFDAKDFRRALEAALHLPGEALVVSEPEATTDQPGTTVSVHVQPLLAVGTATYGVDGEALPEAVFTRLRDRLRAARVPEGVPDPADAKDKKKAAAATAQKGAGAAGRDAVADSADLPPAPDLAYAVRFWALHETIVEVPGTLFWRECVPAEGAATILGRSGHTADVDNGHMWVFGGATSEGATMELADLDLASMQWLPVTVTGVPPAPRAYHASCVIAGAATGGPGRLVVCGGFNQKERLGDCFICDLAKRAWSSVALAGSSVPKALSAVFLRACALGASSALLVGGVNHTDELIAHTTLLTFSSREEPGVGKEPPVTKFSATADRIEAGGDGPQQEPRFSHCIVRLPESSRPEGAGAMADAELLVFGGTNGPVMLEDCWLVEIHRTGDTGAPGSAEG